MLFHSFFLAGFEGSIGYNRHRQWFDQIEATQHDRFADEDYARLRGAGIHASREAVRWPLVDANGHFDFSSLQPFIDAGRRHGVEIIYDLFHFGYPPHIDLFSADFPRRFSEYCYATARYVAEQTTGTCYFTPVNEPSYFSWAAGEAGLFAPHQTGRGFELKIQLIKAAVAGINAIRAACPEARIVNVDPLCRLLLPPHRDDLREEVESFNTRSVFESWDMLSGRLLPELGGSPTHLDIVGINYYWTNQWEWGRAGEPVDERHPGRWPLRQLIRNVWERYGAEMVITETSHVGEKRPVWLRELTQEVRSILAEGIPLRGVCLYPILGMPEWHSREEWTRMGLWDLLDEDGVLKRVLCQPMLEALKAAGSLDQLQTFRRQKALHAQVGTGALLPDKPPYRRQG